MNRSQLAVKLLCAIAVAALLAVAAGMLIRYSDGAIQIPPTPPWTPDAKNEDEHGLGTSPQYRLEAPTEDGDRDAGVAEAARHYAMQFVTPDLKHPESAEFPPEAVRFQRLDLLNRTTRNKIEHWFVHGAVDAKNGYGATVRSQWRLLLGRTDGSFFPVMVMLEEFGIYRFRGHVDMLADARQAALQELAARDAAHKAKKLAARRALWKEIEGAKTEAENAEAALKLAVGLLKAGRTDRARRRLQDLIDQFPDTAAAAQAKELLQQ